MNSQTQAAVSKVGTLPRELLAAVSGVMLVLFILGHLAGNFFIFGGPASYNAYAHHLHSLGPLLLAARVGLLAALFCHFICTAWLVLDNRAARMTQYAYRIRYRDTNVAKTTMIYTGLVVITFVVLHVADFAFGDQAGPRSVMPGANDSLGLYGIVWNSFANPIHSLLYILALCAVGLHLSSAVSTFWMTLGVVPERAVVPVKRAAQALGAVIACAFISIPVYVLAVTYLASAHP